MVCCEKNFCVYSDGYVCVCCDHFAAVAHQLGLEPAVQHRLPAARLAGAPAASRVRCGVCGFDYFGDISIGWGGVL